MRSSLWCLFFVGCVIGWRCNGNIVQRCCCLTPLAPILEQWLISEGIIPQKSDGEELSVVNHPIQDASCVPIKQKAAIFLTFVRPIIENVLITTACPPFGKFVVSRCYSLCLGMKVCYDRCTVRRRVKSRKDVAMPRVLNISPLGN